MDSVRFGRALGIGARSAAKALAGAVDAATAPNPGNPARPPQPSVSSPARAAATGPIAAAAVSAAKTAARTTSNIHETRKGFARGRKRFGEAVWGPFAKLSRVLWLEMTGFFFGIFAVFAGSAVWTHRSDLRATNHDARMHVFVFVAMALVFGYFCISSFVRAYRR